MRRIALVLLSTVALLFSSTLVANASGNNCGDYVSQAAAQSVYNSDTSDPNGLDGNDNDGKACETYDYASNPGTNPGVGGGGGSDDGDTGSDDGGDTGSGDDGGTTTELPNTGSGPSAQTAGLSASLFGALALLLTVGAVTLRRSGFGRF